MSEEKEKPSDRMTPTLSARLHALRFLAIVLVVMLHALNVGKLDDAPQAARGQPVSVYVQVFVNQGFARVAVPLFFAVSGFLFFHNLQGGPATAARLAAKMRRRVRSLVVPYLIWSALGILLFLLLQTIAWSKPFFAASRRIIAEKSIAQLAEFWLLDPIPGQLWFLRDLIVLACLSPAIYWFVRRLGLGVVVPVGGLWALALNPPLDLGPYPIVSIQGLFFFTLGAYLALWRPIDLERPMPGRKTLAAAWLALIAVGVYRFLFQGEPQIVLSTSHAFRSVSIGMGLLALWGNYPLLRPLLESRPGTWLAQFTFVIYAAQLPMLTILRRLALDHLGVAPLAAFFLLPVVVIAICVFAALLTRRLVPPLYAVMTGGR